MLDISKFLLPALAVAFAITKYSSTPQYYSAFEFETSPYFQKLLACSDLKPATKCLAEQSDGILALARLGLTNLGHQAARVCLDQVKSRNLHDSELLLNVQRCFYMAELFALPAMSTQPGHSTSSRAFVETPLLWYFVVFCSLNTIVNCGAFLKEIGTETVSVRVVELIKGYRDVLKERSLCLYESLLQTVRSIREDVHQISQEHEITNEKAPFLPRSFPCSVHGLNNLLIDEFPSIPASPLSADSITVCSDEGVSAIQVKPSFDISKESGRAAMRAYVEAKMRENNYEIPMPNVRYREVPRQDSHRKKLRRVFIPRRGWVSLRRIEMEELQDGRNALVRPN